MPYACSHEERDAQKGRDGLSGWRDAYHGGRDAPPPCCLLVGFAGADAELAVTGFGLRNRIADDVGGARFIDG